MNNREYLAGGDMKEHPILFKPEMVKAVLEGRKKQTRRIVKPQPPIKEFPNHEFRYDRSISNNFILMCNRDSFWKNTGITVKSPYGQQGDVLWVKETAKYDKSGAGWNKVTCIEPDARVEYLADGETKYYSMFTDEMKEKFKEGKRPSIHMPRWASRILLEVVSVRVERVKEISNSDIISEGTYADKDAPSVSDDPWFNFQQGWIDLWDSINSKRGYSWDSNPYVWVIEFKIKEVKT